MLEAGETVERAITALHEPQHGTAAFVYVTGRQRLVGIAPITLLFGAPADAMLDTLAATPPAVAAADMDQEHVAALAADHDMSEMPVVDDAGRLIGVVSAQTIVRVVRKIDCRG